MCGLVGAAGEITTAGKKALTILLRLDVVRGEDSTGVALVKKDTTSCAITKSVGEPHNLFRTERFQENFKEELSVCIGHNRLATQGAVNARNAHPFRAGHIIGAHNGTLLDQTLLLNHREYEVDSENIFYNISQEGIVTTCPKLDGAFALTWYNDQENTINFCRNSQRPLHYCFSSNRKTIFWASEKWMLEVALSKAKIAHGNIEVLPTLVHHELEVPEGNKPFPAEFTKNSLTAFTYTYDRRNNWGGYGADYSHRNYSGSVRYVNRDDTYYSPTVNYLKKMELTVKGGETFKGYANVILYGNKVDEVLNAGCACCGAVVTKEDIMNTESRANAYTFNIAQEYVCEACNEEFSGIDFLSGGLSSNKEEECSSQ